MFGSNAVGAGVEGTLGAVEGREVEEIEPGGVLLLPLLLCFACNVDVELLVGGVVRCCVPVFAGKVEEVPGIAAASLSFCNFSIC